MVGEKIVHSESFYFPDGDIVLLSLPKDNVITAFKVDRVFLARSSPVFEGMLNLPPSNDVEAYDNVPLVNLHDEAEHLTLFLRALYDSRCIPWRKHDRNLIDIAEGILFLANKYQVDHLRERIVSLLERDWPLKLSGWDDNEVEIRARFDDPIHKDMFHDYEDPIPDPCGVIRLARKCDVPSILPAAFYHLSRIRGLTDRHSCGLVETYHPYESNGRSAEYSILSAEDLRCLIVGRDAICHTFAEYLRVGAPGFVQHQSPAVTSQCREGLAKYKEELEMNMLRYRDDALSLMKSGGRIHHRPADVCGACWNRFFSWLNSKREDLWKELPVLFLLAPKHSEHEP